MRFFSFSKCPLLEIPIRDSQWRCICALYIELHFHVMINNAAQPQQLWKDLYFDCAWTEIEIHKSWLHQIRGMCAVWARSLHVWANLFYKFAIRAGRTMHELRRAVPSTVWSKHFLWISVLIQDTRFTLWMHKQLPLQQFYELCSENWILNRL